MSNKRSIQAQQTHLQVQQTYSGPIPPASEMAQYSNIDPTFPQKIMEMALKEQQHRFEKENAEQKRAEEEIKINSSLIKRGIFSSVMSVLIIMSAAVACAIAQQPLPATIIGAGGLGIIVTVLVKGSRLNPDR